MHRSRSQIQAELEAGGVVAAIRTASGEQAVQVARAVAEGGVTALEITMTTPDAVEAIHQIASEFSDHAVVGVGTVLDSETAAAAIRAGAMFVVSPTLDRGVVTMAHRYGRLAIPGAFTPTEIAAAWASGADVVKVFPANVGGPGYFKALHGPLPQVRLMPTGGVDLETAAAWIRAGAVALGVGSALVRQDLVANADWPGLASLAARYLEAVREARTAAERPAQRRE